MTIRRRRFSVDTNAGDIGLRRDGGTGQMGLRRFNNQRVVDFDGRALSGELLVNIDDDDGRRR